MSGEVFTVETIRAITEVSGVPFYLVKWLGYDDPAEDTWEPAESFASKKSLKKLILESDPKFVELNDIKARGYRPFDKYNLVEVKKETIKGDSKGQPLKSDKTKKSAQTKRSKSSKVSPITKKPVEKVKVKKEDISVVVPIKPAPPTNNVPKPPIRRTIQLKHAMERKFSLTEGRRIYIHNEHDELLPPPFEYINTLVYSPSVEIPPPDFMTGCKCRGGRCQVNLKTSPETLIRDDITCSCVNNTECRTVPYDLEDRVLLDPGFAIFECNALCTCDLSCPARLLQKQPRNGRFTIFKCKQDQKGWGVRTEDFIPKNTFVVQYLGEVVTYEDMEAKKVNAYRTYVFDMDVASKDPNVEESALDVRFSIDASEKGNFARFINHSCEPNLRTYAVFIETHDISFHRIGFFAIRDIQPGEELTLDYEGRHEVTSLGKREPRRKKSSTDLQCFCGSRHCRGIISM